MNRKPENVNMVFFVNSDLFYGISLTLPPTFNDIFAATDTTEFKIFFYYIDNVIFRCFIKSRTFYLKSDINIETLGDSKMVSF